VITSDLTVKANFYDFEAIPMDIFTCELENGYLIGCLNAENVGLVYYKLDTQTYYFVSFYGYGWRGASKLSDNVAGVASVYADVKSVIFDENSLSITILTISPDHYYAFSNGSTIEYVYSVNNQEGVYLYNVYENTITQIYADGYWTGFSGKFNELTGSGSTAIITGGSDTYYLKYDFITKKLVEIQYPADGDAIVGF
jgi:hypothetical protein